MKARNAGPPGVTDIIQGGGKTMGTHSGTEDELKGFDVEYADERPEHPDPNSERDYPDGTILHFSMRLHLQKRYLQRGKMKWLMQEIIAQYARIFQIEVLNYSIMDNHVHLIVRLRPESGRAHKMVGLIKQRFTYKYKRWYNGPFLDQKRRRIPALPKGTLWEGRPDPEVVHNPQYLLNCVFYVENNRLKAVHREKVDALLEPPDLAELAGDNWMVCRRGVEESEYGELLEWMAQWPHHSASYWLAPDKNAAPALTDGTDANWVTGEELERWGTTPAHRLPDGWRNVYVGGKKRVLKPTEPQDRSLPTHPVWHALGDTADACEGRFWVLTALACWGRGALGNTLLHDLPPELILEIRT